MQCEWIGGLNGAHAHNHILGLQTGVCSGCTATDNPDAAAIGRFLKREVAEIAGAIVLVEESSTCQLNALNGSSLTGKCDKHLRF